MGHPLSVMRLMSVLALAATIALGGTGSGHALTQEEIAKLSGPDRGKVLLEGARKEGEVSFYTTLIIDQVVRPIHQAFVAKYPDIKLNFIRNDSSQMIQKVLAESRAKSIRVDVIVANAVTAMKNTNLAHPFMTPYHADYPAAYVDPELAWVSFYNLWEGIAWNTNMVRDQDAPKTWEALLDPKWKGKMVWTSSVATGAERLITDLRKLWGEQKALDYIQKLKANDIRTLPGSIRSALDQVIAGEYPIGVNMAMHHIAISKSQGAPTTGVTPEPAFGQSGYINYIRGAPNPHAGMIFIDFLMAPDGGQKVLAEVQYNPAHPKVPPAAELRWIQPNLNGLKEVFTPPEEVDAMTKASVETYQKIFR